MRFGSFAEMVGHYADLTPDSAALIYEEGGAKRVMTYGVLRGSVASRSLDFAGKKSVAFLPGEGGVRYIVDIMAAAQAGARITMLDENLPESTLASLLRQVGADCVCADPELEEELGVYLCPEGEGERGEILFFTSGTTDRSKAVLLSESSLCASAWNGASLMPLKQDDVLLLQLPLNHVFGFVCGLLWALQCGVSVAVGRGMRHYGDDFDFFRPTAVSVVPLLLGYCIKAHVLNPELSLILVGAGECPPQVLREAGVGGRRVSFGYGLTETSSGIALSTGSDPYAMSICPDFRVSIADDGEVLVESQTTMMKGYFGRREETKAVLKDGVLHTGDLGQIDTEGRLHITGRKKDILVLSSGSKIFLPEYEAALAKALGTGELCVVLSKGRPALIVNASVGDRSLVMQQIRPVMENYSRSEQISEIFFTDRPLPRTATGKLKRYEISRLVGE